MFDGCADSLYILKNHAEFQLEIGRVNLENMSRNNFNEKK
jgi:hypothetical protein